MHWSSLHQERQAAQRLPLPTLNGLPLAWKVDPGPQLAQAQQHLGDLKTAVFAVAPQFPPLRSQAQQIQDQVSAIKQVHQCFG
jgi:hypothetical protein